MSKQPQIKIISDGTGYGTQVLDFDGCPIHGISRLNIGVTAGGLVTATLIFENVILDMKAHSDLSEVAQNDGSE